jgi:hypothetical protein
MEQPPSFENKESKESIIDGLLAALGEAEGMSAEDILSDIVTFMELSQEDEGAKVYLEEVAEKIGVTIEEMMRYSANKAK